MQAEAIAEVDAEDLVRANDYYHSMPYFRFADKQDFYKKPVLCAAHVVGIADPVKYRKRPEAVDLLNVNKKNGMRDQA